MHRELSAGQRKQLKSEVQASKTLENVQWTTIALHAGELIEEFERAIPTLLSPIFLRWLSGWITTFRLSREYDFVLVRHMPFDIFAPLFAPFISNRISIHHAKEVQELRLIRRGMLGWIASVLEILTGWVAVRFARGVLGVTNEIADYQVALRGTRKPSFQYSNGIDPTEVHIIDDLRDEDSISIAFFCGFFSDWHGLDRLIDSVRKAEKIPDGFTIHLIGKLPDSAYRLVDKLEERRNIFLLHGFLTPDDYIKIIARADLGISSFALDRKNLYEGSTLKVREMLAMGLPVYSGHHDSALPSNFPYYFYRYRPDIADICKVARSMKEVSRNDVRTAAMPYIGKREAMEAVVDWLRQNFKKR